ncbi:HET domain-containing protein, partial [Diaporthe sp. PMI_573]
MWLLKIEDAVDGVPTIKLEYHVGACPQYAILSHRWGPPSDEVSFQDLQNNPTAARAKAGYRKVEQCCVKAIERGLRYAWIDTSCIDKSSSAELSEAINSMYSWYRDAHVCFAYLEDVSLPYSDPIFSLQFKRSAWFTRGWTLQELLAPSGVIFFTRDWGHEPIGSKASLAGLIHDITSIPILLLVDRNFIPQASVAEKMSWASKRVTTRVEDEAYSLMGLFAVHIPVIYGEGRQAFQRLQEEIMKTTLDHSILAWSDLPTNAESYLPVLAERPAQFLESSDYVPMDLSDFDARHGPGEPGYTMTNFGLRIDLPTCSLPGGFRRLFVAFIAC